MYYQSYPYLTTGIAAAVSNKHIVRFMEPAALLFTILVL